MKKFLTGVIACALIAGMLVSCSSKEEAKTSSAENTKVTTNPSSEATEVGNTETEETVSSEETAPDEKYVPKDPEHYMTSEDFMTFLGSHADKLKQSESVIYTEPDYKLSLENIDENYKTNIDLSVTVGSTKISLPASYKNIEKTGWTLYSDADKKINNDYYSEILYTDDNGDFISLWTTCLDESADRVEINLDQCDFYQIDLLKREATSVRNSDTDIVTRSFEDYGLEFTLANGVNENSTLKDVLNRIGTPGSVSFNGYNAYFAVATLNYYDEEENCYIFNFENIDGDFQLTSATLKFNYRNL